MQTKIAVLVLSTLILSGCIPGLQQQTTQTENPSPTPESSPGTAMTETTQYTLEEISQHAIKDDCWFAIDGAVYDVTPFIAKGIHPGGAEILKGCGKDATELFHSKAGRGVDHSETAQSNLPQFKIGELSQ